jgi:hypothetical protein
MNKEEMLKVVSDYIDLGTILEVIKNENGTYSVYAVCNDGLVELYTKERTVNGKQ